MSTEIFQKSYPIRYFELDQLKFDASLEKQKNFWVRRSDLDLNRHVNNRVFFDWALEALKSTTIENKWLHQVDINFLDEALAGDEISSLCAEQSLAAAALFSHQIRRVSDDKELAKLQTLWLPRT